MNYKTTAILVLVLAVLAGFVYFMRDRQPDYQAVQEQRKADVQGRPVFTADQLAASKVDTLVIAGQGMQARLVKTGNDWRQVEPVEYPLTSWMVDELVNEALAVKYQDSFTPGEGSYPAIDDLGMGPSRGITFTLMSSKDEAVKQTLELGRTITGGRAYAMVHGRDTAYVIADDLLKQLKDEPVHRLRLRNLQGPIESQADRLTLITPELGKVDMVKNQGRWSFAPPHHGRVDKQAVAELLSAITTAPVVDFTADAPESLAIYGLDEPRTQVIVTSSRVSTGDAQAIDSVTQTLSLGSGTNLENTHYFASWTRDGQSPAVITLGKDAVGKFSRTLDSLRDPRLTILKADDIRQIAFHHDGQSIALSRSASGWQFDDPSPGFQADDGVVSEFVNAITTMRAKAFSDQQPGDQPSAGRIELTAIGSTQPTIIDLWTTQQTEQWLVLPRDESVGLIIPADTMALALQPAWAMRDRQVAMLDANQIQRIAIRQSDGTLVELARTLPAAADVAQVGQDTHGPWQQLVSENQANAVDQSLPNTIAAGVSPLQAVKWLEPGVMPAADAYQITVSTGEGKTVVFKVDHQGVALLQGGDQSFELSAGLLKAITASYAQSAAIGLGHAEVSAVTRTMGDKRVTLTVNAAGKYIPDDVAMMVNQDAAAVLMDTLLGLQSSPAVGSVAPSEGNAPAANFIVMGKDGQKRELVLWPPANEEGDYTGQMDGRWFGVPVAAAEKLLADVTMTIGK